MTRSPEIMNAAAWVRAQADAVKSDVGLEVSPAEVSFARQRILALAAGLEAGLDLPDPVEVEHG